MAPLSVQSVMTGLSSAIAVPVSATTRATGLRSTRATGLRSAGAARTWSLARLAGRTVARRTISRRTIAGRALAIGIEAAGIGMVGREMRGVARMSVGTRRTRWPTFALARAVSTFATRTTITCTASRATIPIRTWSARAGTRWARAPRAARLRRLAAVGLAWAARTIRVAMSGRTCIDAIGHIPGAHRCRVFTTLLARAQALAFRTRTLGLEGLL